MSERPLPPRWADRFLAWYCNPELLEEIQGDAHELYYERVEQEGKRKADFKYIWDVIRFCRMSNVRRTEESNEPGLFGILWNLNMKIVIRNSTRNKTVFFVKLSALAICLAFTFLLTGFVINELTYDQQYKNYDRIYRIGIRAEMQGKLTSYATSPLPLAPTLADEVPGIERASRFMFASLVYEVGDRKIYNLSNYAVDSNFLRMFNQEYIDGSEAALDEPNRIVLTESTARRLFGDTHIVGKTIKAGDFTLEVGAVIKDRPLNTHFTFDVLVSWDTFHRNDVWNNVNAYTYIKLGSNVQLSDVDSLITETELDYLTLMSEEYEFTAEPIFERIDDIHTNGYLDEDFAPKRSRNYVYIILSVIVLFLLTGLFNYLNLALAELTTQVKKIAILKTFGGIHADHRKVAITDAILCLLIVTPIVVLTIVGILSFRGYLPAIEPTVWRSRLFVGLVGAVILTILVCSSLNSIVISRKEIMLSLKGNSSGNQKGFTARKFLVAAQLSFAIIMIGLISVIVDQFGFVNDADKGFDDHDVIVLIGTGPYHERQVLEESLRKLSGVKTVAGSSFYPGVDGIEKKTIFSVETPDGMKNRLVNFIYGDKDYTELLNIKLKAGRYLDDRAADKRAYLVNETAVKEFGWDNPIGKEIGGPYDGTVVGVVEDFHFESMHTRIEPLIMFLNNPDWDVFYIYIRTEPLLSNAQLLLAIEQEYRKMWPGVPYEYEYLDAQYRGLYKQDYEIRDIFRSGLIISIIVSALGIFSISALLLSLRTKEMGIRKVVGAENSQLFLMHLKPFAIFFVIATAIGLPVIFYLSQRWLNNFAYHISIDARYFVIPAVVTILIILGAAVYHAIKGARVNPVEILKNE